MKDSSLKTEQGPTNSTESTGQQLEHEAGLLARDQGSPRRAVVISTFCKVLAARRRLGARVSMSARDWLKSLAMAGRNLWMPGVNSHETP